MLLDIREAYDTVWCDNMWVEVWDRGVKGRIWCVITNMYEASRSAILLEGKKSATFRVEQGVAQGCIINGNVEESELGIEINNGRNVVCR